MADPYTPNNPFYDEDIDFPDADMEIPEQADDIYTSESYEDFLEYQRQQELAQTEPPPFIDVGEVLSRSGISLEQADEVIEEDIDEGITSPAAGSLLREMQDRYGTDNVRLGDGSSVVVYREQDGALITFREAPQDIYDAAENGQLGDQFKYGFTETPGNVREYGLFSAAVTYNDGQTEDIGDGFPFFFTGSQTLSVMEVTDQIEQLSPGDFTEEPDITYSVADAQRRYQDLLVRHTAPEREPLNGYVYPFDLCMEKASDLIELGEVTGAHEMMDLAEMVDRERTRYGEVTTGQFEKMMIFRRYFEYGIAYEEEPLQDAEINPEEPGAENPLPESPEDNPETPERPEEPAPEEPAPEAAGDQDLASVLSDIWSDERPDMIPLEGTEESPSIRDLVRRQMVLGLQATSCEDISDSSLNDRFARGKTDLHALAVTVQSSVRHLTRDPKMQAALSELAAERNWPLDDNHFVRLDVDINEENGNTAEFKITYCEYGEKNGKRRSNPLDQVSIFSPEETAQWNEVLNEVVKGYREGVEPKDSVASREDLIANRVRLPIEDATPEEEKQQNIGGSVSGNRESEDDQNRRDEEMAEMYARQNGKDKDEYVRFTVSDTNGGRQNINAKVNREKQTIGLVVTEDQKHKGVYAIGFRGYPMSIGDTSKLFSPQESVFLTKEIKEKISYFTMKYTADTINRHYSSSSPNKIATYDVSMTAQRIKNDLVRMALKSMESEDRDPQKAFENSRASNRSMGDKVMKTLGWRMNPELTPALVMTERKNEKEPPAAVVKIESLSEKSAAQFMQSAREEGLECSYDRVTGVFSMWHKDNRYSEPDIGISVKERMPSVDDYNRMMTQSALVRINADAQGKTVDAKNKAVSPPTKVWTFVRQNTGLDINVRKPSYSLSSEKCAAYYLKSMGMNLNTSEKGIHLEEYPLRKLHSIDSVAGRLSMHRMQIGFADVIGKPDENKVPVVTIYRISKANAKYAEDYASEMGLHTSYDEKNHIHSVAYSPSGRPAFESMSAKDIAEILSQDDRANISRWFEKSAAHTIGTVEAHHAYTNHAYTDHNGPLHSENLRSEISDAYAGIKYFENAAAPKENKDKEKNDQEKTSKFFGDAMEKSIGQERSEALDKLTESLHKDEKNRDTKNIGMEK